MPRLRRPATSPALTTDHLFFGMTLAELCHRETRRSFLAR